MNPHHLRNQYSVLKPRLRYYLRGLGTIVEPTCMYVFLPTQEVCVWQSCDGVCEVVYVTGKDLAKKKQDHHGEAVRRIPWHGYVIFSRPLAATASRWTGRARCRRILLNYVNKLRKKLISTLIYFNSFFNLLPTRSPQNRCNRAPLTSPSGCVSSMCHHLSYLRDFGWLLC